MSDPTLIDAEGTAWEALWDDHQIICTCDSCNHYSPTYAPGSKCVLRKHVERILAARTAPETVALDEVAVTEVLHPHWRTDCSDHMDGNYVRWVRCRCGWESEPSGNLVNAPDLHRVWNAHLAAAIAAADPRRTVAEVKVEALREAAAWIADGIRYPGEWVDMPGIPMPDALWEALVDHVHADVTGEWHGNSLDRDETDSWLRDVAGLPERDAATSEGVEG